MIGRREAVIRLGVGAAGLLVAGRRSLFASTEVRADVQTLAHQIRGAPTAKSFDVASAMIRNGVDWKTMLAAIFLAGVRGIRPRPHGILHCVMMVEASFQLAEASPGEEWLPVLWNMYDYKLSQEDNRRELGEEWILGPPPRVKRIGVPEARREFVAAMEAWDVDRADRAIVALAQSANHAELFETIWPVACRCYAFIGHKMIYAAQLERVVRRIGGPVVVPALRSLTMALLVGRNTTAFDSGRELAPRFPAAWERGKEEPQKSLELMLELRTMSPRESQQRIVAAFRDGLGPRTVWDALRLFGSELFMRRPGRSASQGRSALLPVHAVTVTNAFGHAYRNAKSEQTRRMAILQAAAWLSAMRDDLRNIVGLIDAPATLEVSVDLAQLRTSLFRKGQEHHQFKYAAAIAEESAAINSRWASRILAPAAEYLAHPTDEVTEIYRKSHSALVAPGS